MASQSKNPNSRGFRTVSRPMASNSPSQANRIISAAADPNINGVVGTDLSFGAKYRPFENENLFIVAGAAVLFPQGGYGRLIQSTRPLVSPTLAFQLAF